MSTIKTKTAFRLKESPKDVRLLEWSIYNDLKGNWNVEILAESPKHPNCKMILRHVELDQFYVTFLSDKFDFKEHCLRNAYDKCYWEGNVYSYNEIENKIRYNYYSNFGYEDILDIDVSKGNPFGFHIDEYGCVYDIEDGKVKLYDYYINFMVNTQNHRLEYLTYRRTGENRFSLIGPADNSDFYDMVDFHNSCGSENYTYVDTVNECLKMLEDKDANR